MVLGLILAATVASAAPEKAPSPLETRWEEGERRKFFVQSEVHLPTFRTWKAVNNTDVRVVAYQHEMLLDCGSPFQNKRYLDVECTVEEVSVRGATLPGDKGVLQSVLDETVLRLTGATVTWRQKHDGAMLNVGLGNLQAGLDGIMRQNSRTQWQDEELRQMISRGLAGFDLKLPQEIPVAAAAETGWTDTSSWLYRLPSRAGNIASGEMVMTVARSNATRILIEFSGQGTVTDSSDSGGGGGANVYKGEIGGRATFDYAQGVLSKRYWASIAQPTAGGMQNEGYAGLPYMQRGDIRLIREGEPDPKFAPSVEMTPPGETSSTLQNWATIIVAPR